MRGQQVRGCLCAALCVFVTFAPAGRAQNYPAKVIRYIVSGSAGSGTDTLGRMIANGLSQTFGQQVIVDNRPGGGGNIAPEIVARSPPDGYTVFQNTITHASNVTLYRNLPYSITRDFAPVTQIAAGPAVVAVHPSLPAKSVKEFVALARARPGAINYASGGTGTFTFLAVEMFKGQAGIDLLHVPYRGGGAALAAVISGEVAVFFSPVATALPNVKQGRLRPLAVTTAKRVRVMPELPTVAESGYPGYASDNWYGLVVPAKTPKEVIATLRNGVVGVLNRPEVARRMDDLGYVPVGSTPEDYGAFVRGEIERLGKVVRALNLTAE